MQWQGTDDVSEKTPYAYRHKCLHESLDLSDITDRHILGRAFYHMIQRRGFFLTSSLRTPKIFIKEFGDFLMPCHQHCLGVNLLVQR